MSTDPVLVDLGNAVFEDDARCPSTCIECTGSTVPNCAGFLWQGIELRWASAGVTNTPASNPIRERRTTEFFMICSFSFFSSLLGSAPDAASKRNSCRGVARWSNCLAGKNSRCFFVRFVRGMRLRRGMVHPMYAVRLNGFETAFKKRFSFR